jgi:hypothetical protein
MKLNFKRILAGLGAVGFAVTLLAVPAAPAQAALSCTGTQVSLDTLYNSNGAIMGRMGIYRDGPIFCGVMVKAGWAYGERTWVSMDVHPSNSVSPRVTDAGWAYYQTSAVKMDARNSSTGCLAFWSTASNREGLMVASKYRTVCR